MHYEKVANVNNLALIRKAGSTLCDGGYRAFVCGMVYGTEWYKVRWRRDEDLSVCAKNIKSLRRRKQSFNSRFLLIWIIS